MRCLIIGCGSIGTRRAKILASMGHEVFASDPDLGQQQRLIASLPDRLRNPDLGQPEAVLICTPPDSGRPEQIERCLGMGVRGLFVEKPLALSLSDVDEIRYIFERLYKNGEDITTMGACNLRFVGGVSGLRKIKKPWRLAAFRMGQHKKHWSATHRPISMILDSIHELDLAVHLNGPIQSIRGYSETDSAEVSVHHVGGGLSHLYLDRWTDPPVRSVTVTRGGDRDFLRLQTNDSMYEREMRHFMECVEAGVQTCNPLRAAAEVCARALEVVE